MRSIVLVLAMWGSFGWAQEGEPDRLAAARAFVASEGVQRSIDASLSPTLVTASLEAQLGDRLTEAERTEIAAVVTEEMRAIRPAMEASMAQAAAGTYTAREMEAMTDFYGSEEGASILAKQAGFMQAYLAAVAPDLQAATERAMARAAEAAEAE